MIYLEQGLWIAAEQREEYEMAAEQCGKAEDIVRRMLRYRGEAGVKQTARRYGWREEFAREVLEQLCLRGEIIAQEEMREQGGKEICYYHAKLYKRARAHTLKNRRREIATCPPASYAALLVSRIRRAVPAEEGIREAVASLLGVAIPAEDWEKIIFPARVKNYRENLLDHLLSLGEFFWRMGGEKGKICFESTGQLDWDAVPDICWDQLSEKERLLAETLAKRGASFMQALNGVLSGESPYDTLLSLMEKGVVNADSYLPVRQWASRDKIKKAPDRRRVSARVKALSAGRWELVKPLKPLAVQEQMDRCFDRYIILCRETAAACNLPWQEALSRLRVQEYTGQVRRGYFTEGLSGAQFIRKKDFESVTASLLRPQHEIVWLNAADPMQPWGKLLPHEKGRSFMNVPGTAVALCGGRPVAVFERRGSVCRIFEEEKCGEAIGLFAKEYKKGAIFPERKRIVVKHYPEAAAGVFAGNGFIREMKDYSLYK